jgi:CRP/FNR family transcriptional regulator, cyclic AMP receptor protein
MAVSAGREASGRVVGDEDPPNFLADLPDPAKAQLLADAIHINVPAGVLVYRDNERPRVILVIHGLLRVFLRSPDGREVTARYVRSGEVAGLPLVVGGPGPESIQAMTSARLAALRVDHMRALLATDPQFARACAAELVRQLYQTFEELSEQAFLSVRQRIVFHLLNLATPDDGPELTVRASHEELAEAVASSREVVTRNLHRIRDDGLIVLTRDGIVLRNPIGLAREISPRGRTRSMPGTPPEPDPSAAGVSALP